MGGLILPNPSSNADVPVKFLRSEPLASILKRSHWVSLQLRKMISFPSGDHQG